MDECSNDNVEYHNDFRPDWILQEVRISLDAFVSMREQIVRLAAERDAYAQKWSQSLIEIEKLRNENAELRAANAKLLVKGD